MEQGLEVLWWKHNMIPTKESIHQPPPNIHLPQASHPPLTYRHPHSSSPLLPTFLKLQSDWNQSGLLGCRLVDEAQKAKVFTRSSHPVLHWGFFQSNLPKKEKSGRPLKFWRVPKSCHALWIPTLGTHFHSDSSRHTSRTPTFRGLFYFHKCRRGTQVLSPRLIWASGPLFNLTPPFFPRMYLVSRNANEGIHAG